MSTPGKNWLRRPDWPKPEFRWVPINRLRNLYLSIYAFHRHSETQCNIPP
jgi:hypothetical protein